MLFLSSPSDADLLPEDDLTRLLLEAEEGESSSISSWGSSSDDSLPHSSIIDPAPLKAQQTKDMFLSIDPNKWKRAYTQLCHCLKCYAAFCWSSANQELLLKFLQWTLWMLGNTSLLGVDDYPPTPFQDWMTAVSDQLAWARYANRLLGLPSAIEAALTNSWCSDPSYTVYRLLGRFLAWSMVFYYPTEAVAYLQWNMPPGEVGVGRSFNWFAPSQWSSISCCFWCIYVIADLVQCLIKWYELSRRKRSRDQTKKFDGSTTGSTDEETDLSPLSTPFSNAGLISVQVQTAKNCLHLLPSIQYSLPAFGMNAFLHPYTINTLMWSESIVAIYQAMRNQ